LLIENRHGLIADARTVADGLAEREAATLMIAAQWERAPGRRRTVAADKAYDVADSVGLMRELNTTPHVGAEPRPAWWQCHRRGRRGMGLSPKSACAPAD
jgi:hypothetical protein